MSRYAVDVDRHALVVSWPTELGDVSSTVAELPSGDEGEARELAAGLTALSAALWRTYTEPASAVAGSDSNDEEWRRDEERGAFEKVAQALRKPHLPDGGYLIQPYSPIEANAHRVGRALHDLADELLVSLVAGDVETEMEAVRDAELGTLTGRAGQAVALTRADASPVQVVAADKLLAEDPLGSIGLFDELDPVASSIAAAHWLEAAAIVTARASGLAPEQVVLEADNIEALPHQTPTLVLDRLAAGESAREIVLELIEDAMAVAKGIIPDVDALEDALEAARANAERFAIDAEDFAPRLTPLDPTRPAVDLLQDLLFGIRGCWLIYQDARICQDAGDLDEDDPEADRAVLGEFCDAVRAEAASTRETLS